MLNVFKILDADTGRVAWRCPGCGKLHARETVVRDFPGPWNPWNGDMEQPTFEKNVRYRLHSHNEDGSIKSVIVCDSTITDGVATFINDTSHEFAGQSLPIQPWV